VHPRRRVASQRMSSASRSATSGASRACENQLSSNARSMSASTAPTCRRSQAHFAAAHFALEQHPSADDVRGPSEPRSRDVLIRVFAWRWRREFSVSHSEWSTCHSYLPKYP
jgi:hypothetical protein